MRVEQPLGRRWKRHAGRRGSGAERHVEIRGPCLGRRPPIKCFAPKFSVFGYEDGSSRGAIRFGLEFPVSLVDSDCVRFLQILARMRGFALSWENGRIDGRVGSGPQRTGFLTFSRWECIFG